jgi:inositol phosphorylceramide mannosyltransferase catalytic subunit
MTELKMPIPKIIHQTYFSNDENSQIKLVASDLIKNNTGYEYRFYDDYDCLSFIRDNYPSNVIKAYNSINPIYTAARADLFRYLVIYKIGGIYLDIKSTFFRPIDDLIEYYRYILCHWDNAPSGRYPNYGLHFSDLPFGEFQQWHVISEPKHEFLAAVIDHVLKNIQNYSIENFGVGRMGVLQTTGPIAYTKAIAPLINNENCKVFRTNYEAGLVYNYLEIEKYKNFEKLNNNYVHYTKLDEPIINN